ncbi:MAG: hypothetical protein ACAI38_16170 [Myxococcota bacterium]|nr:hypothetical protein [Myxococcota bacterium]
MVTPGALAASSGLSVDLATEYLRGKGAATGELPTTQIMLDFIAARAARATIDHAIAKAQESLPALYAPPPKPATDLLEQRPPHLRRRYPDLVAWDRGIYKAFPIGVVLGLAPYFYLSTHDHKPAIALAASALVAGVVTALPALRNAVANFFERRAIAKANTQISLDEEKQVEAFKVSREANADRIKQQQDELDAWVAGNAAAADKRAHSITSVHLEPVRNALEAVKDTQLRKHIADVAKPLLEQLLHTRRSELSVGVAADAESWIALAHSAGSPSAGTLLGFAIDHFNPSDPKERYWAEVNLAAIKDESSAAIADAYRARLYERDAARSPGHAGEQVRTLVMLKRYGSTV